jgi:regulator of cell morphogenesis and NO signaling
METYLMNTEILSAPITIDPQDTLNAIVARFPQTLPVLQAFGLDTCCGGALPLRTAVEHHHLDLRALLAALHAVVVENRP